MPGRRRGCAFLYPFLDGQQHDTSSILGDVAASIRGKAREDERLRNEVARDGAQVAAAIESTSRYLAKGATVLIFGNGGSATDANDWALDCVGAGEGRPVPAISLSIEPATITAVANDIGRDAISCGS